MRSSAGFFDSFFSVVCLEALPAALPTGLAVLPPLQPMRGMLRARAATHAANSFLVIFMGPRHSMCIAFRPMSR